MKKFINRILIFSLALAMLVAIFLFVLPRASHDVYAYCWGEKFRILEKSSEVESGRIIIIGSSSANFSVNSELIAESTGKPVINLGYRGRCAPYFYANVIKQYAKPNDIIIWVGEFFFFTNKFLLKPPFPLVYYDLSQYRFFEPKDYGAIFRKIVPMNVKWGLKTITDLSFLKAPNYNVNKYGDLLIHKDITKGHPHPVEWQINDTTITNFELINEIKTLQQQQNNIKHYFIMGPCGKPLVRQAPQFGKIIDKGLQKAGIQVLANSDEVIYPNHFFYDSYHHLLWDKRDVFTKLLIDRLKAQSNS